MIFVTVKISGSEIDGPVTTGNEYEISCKFQQNLGHLLLVFHLRLKSCLQSFNEFGKSGAEAGIPRGC